MNLPAVNSSLQMIPQMSPHMQITQHQPQGILRHDDRRRYDDPRRDYPSSSLRDRRERSPDRRGSKDESGHRLGRRDRSLSPSAGPTATPFIPGDEQKSLNYTRKEIEQGPPYCERFMDHSIPNDCVKVMSRTLYVGGIHAGITTDIVRQTFEKVGRVETVQINYDKYNAFVKMYSHKEAIEAREKLNDAWFGTVSTCRVGWGCGFGPKNIFNFDGGFSIIPIFKLRDEEREWVKFSQRGGGPLLGQVVMEEPDVAIGPAHDSSTGRPQQKDPSRDVPGGGSSRGGRKGGAMKRGPREFPQGANQIPIGSGGFGLNGVVHQQEQTMFGGFRQ